MQIKQTTKVIGVIGQYAAHGKNGIVYKPCDLKLTMLQNGDEWQIKVHTQFYEGGWTSWINLESQIRRVKVYSIEVMRKHNEHQTGKVQVG
jgi:hypothetical protein